VRLHYLQHVPFEGPGIIRSWSKNNNHSLSSTRLYKGEDLPPPRKIDGLIVMGGPMGIDDEKAHAWLKKEKRFINGCIDQEIKVMGICLGAQLIADVMGADVYSMNQKEIGWFPINWKESARKPPLLDFLPARQTVLHWHGDQFNLPDEALPLASSKGCPNQGFLVNEQILGLQFHLEMTKEGLDKLIQHSNDELKKSDGPFIQSPVTMLNASGFEENHETMKQILNRFFK
jgi:GMP synthase (glutamine-hydrolysing)